MQIAIVADIHVRLTQHKEFEAKRFNSLIDALIANSHKVLIISGDLFDFARPSLEEIKLVYSGLSKLNASGTKIIILAGNHEAVTKSTSTYDYIDFSSVATVIHNITTFDIENRALVLCPWNNINELLHKSVPGDILVSHFRSDYGIIKEEINVAKLCKPYAITVLGDIHHRHSPQAGVIYTGSPYSTKFVAPGEQYGYLVLDLETLDYKYIDLYLPCKYKITVELDKMQESIDKYSDDLLRISVQGDLSSLEKLVSSESVTYNKIPIHTIEDITIDTPAQLSITEYILDAISSTNKGLVQKILDEIDKEIR